MKKTKQLRQLIDSPELSIFLEAHDGLSGRIVEEAGLQGIWASSLTLSAALGVRDNNEASWTQVADHLEFLCDATGIPVLADGDTGYGDFNTFRRVVRKMEQRGVAGLAIEDKVYPKTNSFLREGRQPLEPIEAFCAKLKAGKDAREDGDFILVARTEALITGHGLEEALRRADAYRDAGADALIIHSKATQPDEVLRFLRTWEGGLPVILIPTRYYSTPPDQLWKAGASVVIWANHLLRASIQAMQETACRIARDRSVIGIEDQIAPLQEVFRLQRDDELQEAERKYRQGARGPRAIILAATRGSALEDLTEALPKALLPVAGRSLLERHIRNLRALEVEEIHVVAGYRKEAMRLPGIVCHDNDAWERTGELVSLDCAREVLEGPTLILYGDILCRRYILQMLLADPGDFVLAVDPGAERRADGRPRDLVRLRSGEAGPDFLESTSELKEVVFSNAIEAFDGEWTGLMKVSTRGAEWVRTWLDTAKTEPGWDQFQMGDLLNALVKNAEMVRVHCIPGHWCSVETALDLLQANRNLL